MRILVMGTGGIGGYFGGRLAHGGADVAFVARGPHLEALRTGGLRVASPLGDLHLPRVRAGDDPAALGPADLVLVAVKLWDTDSAVRALAPVVRDGTAVVSFQNGVQKDGVLRHAFGAGAVMGGLAYISATIEAPGLIRHTGRLARLAFGEFDGTRSARAEALLAACERGGIEASIPADVRRATWEKFVFLVGLSGVTAGTRQSVGPVRSNPLTRALLLDVMREVVAVARAQGVGLPADYAEERLAFIDTLPPELTASMAVDLERGNRLEVPWLSGGVVALGEAAGVPTPLNRAVRDLLALHADGAPGR